jgi:signal transduction histidine kinase
MPPAVTVDEWALYPAYRTEVEGGQLIRSTRAAALVVIILSSAFIALDAIAYPEKFGGFLGVRLGLNLVLAAIYVRFARTHPVPSALLGCLAIGGALLWVIEGAGGLLGEYYVGLVLLFVGMPVFMPYSAPQAGVLVTVLLGALAGFPFFEGPIDWRTYLLHLFFPAAAAVECVASCAVLDRARFRDFLRRQEVEKAHEDLKQLDVEKSRFTANVHHELRTPLTLLLAPLDAMLAGEFGPVSDRQREYLATMRSNGARLARLINNLLDLGKIESGKLQLRRRQVRLGSLVEEIASNARPMAERKQVALATHGLGELPMVCVDPDAIEKVVVNLIGNALKFTEAGGRIEIGGQGLPDGGVRLVVADSGCGIPADELERIFDRFAQVDSSSTRRHEGTGIGLSLARELVELHGGRIWAESDGPGRGARIWLELPPGSPDADREPDAIESTGTRGDASAASEEADRRSSRLAEVAAELAPDETCAELRHHVDRLEVGDSRESPSGKEDAPEVLVCEDNPDMRRLLADLLGREFRVRTASNGREGLERIRAAAPSVVVTDVMMPEMSGTELCQAIKADPALAGIPVVIVTSRAEREVRLEGLELGADDYVAKPFHPRELLARVRSLARMRRLQEEAVVRTELLQQANHELEAALAELREAHAQLVHREKMASLGQFVAGIAHEINNPLNFIQGNLFCLREYVDVIRRVLEAYEVAAGVSPEARERLAAARAQADLDQVLADVESAFQGCTEGVERSTTLVADLRTFSRLDHAQKADADLEAALDSTLNLLRSKLTGIRLVKEYGGIPPVECLAGQLNQVFVNLVANAADAVGSDGTIAIRTRVLPHGMVEIEVEDDGKGIEPEHLDKIFDPFFTTKEVGKGTGLGLAISYGVVTRHGGSIRVESQPGRRTRFRVQLPVKSPTS